MNMRRLTVFFMIGVLLPFVSIKADSIPVANHSFESPVVPPGSNPPAYPAISDWIELDRDGAFSANTGVFTNVTEINYADADQLGFLGSEAGNALLQNLAASYQVGRSYKMTVGVCVSGQYLPPDPNGLYLAFYYTEAGDPNAIDIVFEETPSPSTFTSTALEDCSVYLPTVEAEDAWADKAIGIAIRAFGLPGGFWDLDNVRVVEFPLVPEFTGDSFVNLTDFAMMASDWLYCDDPFTDVTGEGCVDGQDLLILAEYWLDNV
jgi:hypothetical protein